MKTVYVYKIYCESDGEAWTEQLLFDFEPTNEQIKKVIDPSRRDDVGKDWSSNYLTTQAIYTKKDFEGQISLRGKND